MAVAFRITGSKELERAFRQFEPKLQKKIARATLTKAAKPLLAAAKANITSTRLRKTLVIKKQKLNKLSRHRSGVVVTTDYERVRKIQSLEGETGGPFNPHWFEYGVPGHMSWSKSSTPIQARPFMRPAVISSSSQVQAILASEMWRRINETARELRAKA